MASTASGESEGGSACERGMRVVERGRESEKMVFRHGNQREDGGRRGREVVVMLVESGEREAARSARYRITFACFCFPALRHTPVRFRLIAMGG